MLSKYLYLLTIRYGGNRILCVPDFLHDRERWLHRSYHVGSLVTQDNEWHVVSVVTFFENVNHN